MLESNKITAKQNRHLHALIQELALSFDKADLVSQYTQGRTDHSSEMSFIEAENLISYLKVKSYQAQGQLKPAREVELKEKKAFCPASDKMRKKIIFLAHQLYWHNEAGKIDLARIDNWCEKSSPHKKKLNELSRVELVDTVNAFEAMYKKYLSESAKR